MKRIRKFARNALEAATALYAVIALTLILRSVKAEAEDEDSEAISDYERGRRDERRVLLAEARVEEREEVWEARRDASTERAQGIAREHSPLSSPEILEARVGKLEARVRNNESENENWRKVTSGVFGDVAVRVKELERREHEPVSSAVLDGGVSSLKARVAELERREYTPVSNSLLEDGIESLRARVRNLEINHEGWAELNRRVKKLEEA